MNNIAEIRQNVDDFEKFKNGIKKFFDKVDEMGQEVSTINNYFSFLSKYGYKASCGFGKGKLSYKPFVVFIRTDSGYDSALKGVYCRVNIFRGTDNVSVEINESEQKQIRYKAQQDCKQYNKDKSCKFKRNDLDDIVEQVLKDMEWFANLPLDSIKDNATTTIKPQNGKEKPQPDINKNKGENMKTIPPLNQILYGPPGTGKTYSTIDKALEILRHYKVIDKIPESREVKRAIFDEYRTNKQIEFVTFHQSFSYEEFVEGIKPKLTDSSAESNEVSYTIKSGIFKEICKKALKNCDSSNKIILQEIQERIKTNPCVWKVSLGGKQVGEAPLVQEYCFKHNEIRIAHLDKGDGDRVVKPFKDTMQKGDFVGVFSEKYILKAIGIIVGDYEEKEAVGDNFQKIAPFKRTRKVKWLLKNEDIDSGKNLSNPQDAVFDSGIKAKDLFEKIQDRVDYTFDDLPKQITCKDLPKKPYILIIDEINRGNISKILGELITLIEPSKRIGASEELRVTLPYSNDSFGVPSNLYIIGTMNTADRSIALLDTALRRRFEFVEMMPDSKLLKDNKVENTEINLQTLLEKMNERIEFLLDREHTIGHSFFIGVDFLDKLREVFKLKIIPLLQEYFYDDYAKIQAVLNDNDMIKPKPKPEFLSKFSDEVNDEKVVYEIEKEWQKWESWQFVKIYNSKATKSQSQDSNKSDENE